MYSKEVKRWLKALEIAEILFEDEGYHGIYLNQIREFIRRRTMYSPKIGEEFIPTLFQIASSKKMPMTKLVNRIIKEYLEKDTRRKERHISDEPKQQSDGIKGIEAKGGLQKDLGGLPSNVVYEAKDG